MSSNEKQHSETVRIVLVDDHQIVREGLRRSLAQEADLVICGEAGDGRSALQLLERVQPRIIVMDLGLPDGDGLIFARQILARWPMIKIIILSALVDRRHLDEAIDAGVSGYVLKVNAASELIRAIRSVMKDEAYLCSEASATLVGGYKELRAEREQQKHSLLSEREIEVLKFIAEGRNTKEIADTLGLSIKTVESHRLRVMAKLNLHGVAELTRYAIRSGITTL